MYEHDLEKAYRIADWMDDPRSPSGRERYLEALNKFDSLLKHPWFKPLTSRGSVKIVDIGAGRGIGGIAFAKTLAKHSIEYVLYMVDIRRDALKDAIEFAREEGVEAETYQLDALKIHETGLKDVDIVLMYGAILAHFNEWSFTRLLASSTSILNDNGLIIIEEMDRSHILFTRGYKNFIVEKRDPGGVSISVHRRYDKVSGSYYRLFIDLRTWDSVEIPINFRSISHIASVLWMFMKDIDIITTSKPDIYLVVGKNPRKKILPKDLENDPYCLKPR